MLHTKIIDTSKNEKILSISKAENLLNQSKFGACNIFCWNCKKFK